MKQVDDVLDERNLPQLVLGHLQPDLFLEKPVDPILLRRLVGKLLKAGPASNGQATAES